MCQGNNIPQQKIVLTLFFLWRCKESKNIKTVQGTLIIYFSAEWVVSLQSPWIDAAVI